MVIKIGVLELQGGYALHHNLLSNIGINSIPVKSTSDLEQSDGLIIPGGESTTLSLLMTKYKLREPIIEFAKTNPVLGTCAGLIMMSKEIDDKRVNPLRLLNVIVNRNAYGRQINSARNNIVFQFNSEKNIKLFSTFIRAPKIISYGEDASIVARLQGHPVAVLSNNLLGLSFHPEIDGIDIFHKMMFKKSSNMYHEKHKSDYAA